MKKNILLIPSLVLCSFIALPILAMDTASTNPENEYHPITTNLIDGVDIIGIAQLDLPEPQSNPMLQSVIPPTKEKGLGAWGTVLYYCRTNVNNIISYLTNETYDVTNKSHFNLLNTAIQDAITNDDDTSLKIIMALCRKEKYRNSIRIEDDNLANNALCFLTSDANTKKYDLAIQLADKNIEDGDQQLRLEYNKIRETFINTLAQITTAYQQEIGIISNKFNTLQKRETEQAQASITNLGALNRSIRNKTEEFKTAHPIKIKENEIIQQSKTVTRHLNRLSTTSTLLPKMAIKELEAQPTDK